MVRTKPVVGGWSAPTETDPGALKTTGYSSGISPKSSEHNWLFNRWSEWNEYNKVASNGEYHVDVATGNDTTGDGSSAAPWATIDKALSELPEYGIVNIYLYGAGTVYTVSTDVTIYCSVNILNASTETAKLNFGSYGGGAGVDNEKYVITMINGFFNVLTTTESTVIDAPDSGEAWAANSTVFAIEGESGVSFYSELTFETTTAAASGYYTLIRSTGLNAKGILKLNTYSSVNISGSDGYIFEAYNTICQLGASNGTFDDETLIIKDPIYQNDILHVEFVDGSQAPVITGGTGGNFTIGFGGVINTAFTGMLNIESTTTIAWNASEATLEAAISGISNIPMTAKNATIIANTNAILNFDVELYGTSEGEMSPNIVAIANSITGGDVIADGYRWWYKQRASKKILNLIEGYSINKMTV